MSVTSIEWTKRPGTIGEVWNPTTGCNKVDRGCKHCYAEIMHRRLQAMGQEKYKEPFLAGAVAHESMLEAPLKWTKPRTVFVNSMSDLFHTKISFEFIRKVFDVMEATPQHTYLILTKRPEEALDFWTWRRNKSFIGCPEWKCPPNVWMGTSVNDQASADKRVPLLLKLDGCLRFISYEPATGPVDFTRITISGFALDEDGRSKRVRMTDSLRGLDADIVWEDNKEVWSGIINRDKPRLHWIICGGESGPKADPMHPGWARKVRDDCQASGVPFFFKQHGAWAPINYRKENQEIYIKFNLGKNEFLFPEPPQNMVRLGKGASGHELDGQTIQQYPQA